MTYDLSGKSIVVTGATSGIGLAVAEKMAKAGAFVIGIGRSAERNDQAIARIKSNVTTDRVIYLLADLASQHQVRRVAGEIKSALGENGLAQLDVLVNNAGVYMARKVMTDDGIETTFAVNHLAGFLLTHDLLPLLQRGQGRVLTTSSYSHRTTPLCLNRVVSPWPHIGLTAYKRSKLSNVLFTYELNRRNLGVTAFAVDPGLVNTAIASKGSDGIEDLIWRRRRLKGTPAEVPARTYLYLAAMPEVDKAKGYYFKDSAFLAPSRRSENPQLARKLWDLSSELTGVEW